MMDVAKPGRPPKDCDAVIHFDRLTQLFKSSISGKEPQYSHARVVGHPLPVPSCWLTFLTSFVRQTWFAKRIVLPRTVGVRQHSRGYPDLYLSGYPRFREHIKIKPWKGFINHDRVISWPICWTLTGFICGCLFNPRVRQKTNTGLCCVTPSAWTKSKYHL